MGPVVGLSLERGLPAAAPAGTGAADAAAVHVATLANGEQAIHLVVENMHCAGCMRRIERALGSMDGMREARVNLSTERLYARWDPRGVGVRDILATLEGMDYRAAPFDPARLAAGEDASGRELLRALAVAAFAAMNVMLISIAVWAGQFADMGPATRGLFHWLSALIALPAVVYAGRPFLASAWGALRARRLNMDVPISLAVLLAGAMSLAETMWRGDQVYFDAALMLLFFLLVGRYLDHRMRRKARSCAQNLLALRAGSTSLVASDGTRHAVPTEALRPGMTVAVAAGERVPADGVITSGEGSLDASLVSGESLPRRADPGSEVFAGTLNLGDELLVRVTAADEETLLAEIVRLMEAAEQRKSHYARLADRAARIYAPTVHVVAGATFLGWLALSGLAWHAALLNAIAVLIITCPCALGLAAPMVQVVAGGRLLRRGVLIKSGDALERLGAVDTVLLDKTGTLTRGEPALINGAEIAPEDLRLAASLAAASRHPLAKAITRAVGPVPVLAGVREERGMGLAAAIDDAEIRLGSRRWLGVAEEPRDPAMELWLAIPSRAPVRFLFRDPLRPDAALVVSSLERAGMRVALLSGDRRETVGEIAALLGIEDWQGAIGPDAKIARIEALREGGRRVLMVGDGLNDAPALAAADVSISPSGAADVSHAAADFIFLGERLTPVLDALTLARGARRLMLQNFALALLYNLIAVPLAVGGFVTPLIAAIAMSASSLAVTANALRLR